MTPQTLMSDAATPAAATGARPATDAAATGALPADAPLACRHVVHGYGGTNALNGATLSLAQGTVLGLLGRNGAGKSTLIRALLGLVEPDAGDCRAWGRPALAMDDAAKARLGYVPQQPEAMAWMKVGEMLDFVGRFYPRWDAGWVASALDRWQLPRNRGLATLSPGERQKVAIVRALGGRPDLLVLDEPAAALDPVARRELLREIAARAADTGITVLFSTHIVSDLERVASHVAVLHGGRVVLQGEIDGLKERALRLQVPAAVAAALPERLPGELARRLQPGGGLALTLLRDDPAEPWPMSLPAPGVHATPLALEDLFIEVAS